MSNVEAPTSFRFAGVCLGGGKTERTAVVVVEYYSEFRKIFVRKIYKGLGGEEKKSADQVLLELLNEREVGLKLIAFDVPLTLPTCFNCPLKCPGYENCTEPGIQWQWVQNMKRDGVKRPNKIFTPYTERPVEVFVTHNLEEPFQMPHALGSNAAPLTARAQYLTRRLKVKSIEFFAKLSLWRIGNALSIQKSYLRFHRHAIDSEESRDFFLKRLVEDEVLFIYAQDQKILVDDPICFDALLGALTAHLHVLGQTEKPPSDFPKKEGWIAFPKTVFNWFGARP
jgi:hypothetical protein